MTGGDYSHFISMYIEHESVNRITTTAPLAGSVQTSLGKSAPARQTPAPAAKRASTKRSAQSTLETFLKRRKPEDTNMYARLSKSMPNHML